NFSARPTTDFAKESLFNIINNNFDFEEIRVLDLFSGTGSISYEFASRGCEYIRAVELNKKQCLFINQTAESLKMEGFRIINGDSFRFLKATTEKYDIIFADPPYEMPEIEKIHKLVFEKGLLNNEGWLILEHSAKKEFKELAHFQEKRKYGHVNFSIFYITSL
ncbi:MAG: RsmD family RNA methyltransferase, partial [Bacteroidales bacterium]|nr:RsmD family RNA methyltransferase [Bacteroidales bacterium]